MPTANPDTNYLVNGRIYRLNLVSCMIVCRGRNKSTNLKAGKQVSSIAACQQRQPSVNHALRGDVLEQMLIEQNLCSIKNHQGGDQLSKQ